MKERELDISNYEEWLIDRLDGNLSADEEAELSAFLLAHPELDVEISEMVLQAPALTFQDKEDLRMPEGDELLLITALEAGEHESELPAQLRKDFALYRKTILQADETIIFQDKAALKRDRAIIIPLWAQRLAIAASFIGVLLMLLPSEDAAEYIARDRLSAELPSWDIDQLPASYDYLMPESSYANPLATQDERPSLNQAIIRGAGSTGASLPSPAPAIPAKRTDVHLAALTQIAPEAIHNQDPSTELRELLGPSEAIDALTASIEPTRDTQSEAGVSKTKTYRSVKDYLVAQALDKAKEKEVLVMDDKPADAKYVRTSVSLGGIQLSRFKQRNRP